MTVFATLPTRHQALIGSGPFTLDTRAQNGCVIIDSADPVSVVIPDNEEISFPLGTTIYVVERGAGAVTVTTSGTDTIAGTTSTLGAASILFLIKIDETVWDSVRLV